MRATLRLSSPAWLAQPKNTSSTCAQSAPALRAISARMGSAARSSARTLASAPAIAADGRPDRRRRERRRGSCCASVGFPGAGLNVARRCEFLDVGSGLSCVPTFCDMPTGGQASCTGVRKRTCRADLPSGLAVRTRRADLPSRLGSLSWQASEAGTERQRRRLQPSCRRSRAEAFARTGRARTRPAGRVASRLTSWRPSPGPSPARRRRTPDCRARHSPSRPCGHRCSG